MLSKQNYRFLPDQYIKPFKTIVFKLTGKTPTVLYRSIDQTFTVIYGEDKAEFSRKRFIRMLDDMNRRLTQNKETSYSTSNARLNRQSLLQEY